MPQPLLRPQLFTARLEERVVFNDKYVELDFELTQPTELQFSSGQYVSIKVSDDGTRRPYSIVSRPDITHGFELLIDLAPQGVGVKYLEQLQLGDKVSLLAPMGRFVLAEPAAEPELIFIATGSGIAPLKSMVLDLLQLQHDQRPMTLYWGLRQVEQMFWQDEFQELAEAFPNFKFHPVISQPLPEWTLCRGRVTDCLVAHQQPDNAGYYICGGPQMVTDTIQLLLSQGVNPQYIHHEKFT